MKKMKNLLLCSGMVLVLALAAGCGDASEKDDQNGTVTEDQETTDETTDENDTMDENTTEGTTDKDTDKDVDTPVSYTHLFALAAAFTSMLAPSSAFASAHG